MFAVTIYGVSYFMFLSRQTGVEHAPSSSKMSFRTRSSQFEGCIQSCSLRDSLIVEPLQFTHEYPPNTV